MRGRPIAWLPLLALLQPAALPARGLSGDASMRVEVEVYKGPAGQSAPAQVGQLSAVLAESVRATGNWLGMARAWLAMREHRHQCRLTPTAGQLERADCEPLREAIQSGEEVVHDICEVFPAWIDMARLGGSAEAPATLTDACALSPAMAPGRPEELFAVHAAEGHSDTVVLDRTGTPTASTGEESPRMRGPIVLGSSRVGARPWLWAIMDNYQELDRRLSGVATAMKSKALRVADANVAAVPRDAGTRSLLVSFAYLTSEYANQIEGRLDVLVKLFEAREDQCRRVRSGAMTPSTGIKADDDPCDGSFEADPTRARTLPMTAYLRNADTTDMLQLYDWLRAAPDASGVGLDREARIAMARRLTADHFWQKINEVYASGQGDVAMAFVKDDLGNWNLKSFSNDPAELLAGYRGAASAALKAVAKLATRAANPASGAGLGAARTLLGLANQLATGESTEQAVALDPATLHARAFAKLAARRATYASRQTALTEALTKAEEALKAAGAADAPAKQASVDEAKARLAALADDARTAIGDILDDHLAVVAALQEAAAPAATPAAATTTQQDASGATM